MASKVTMKFVMIAYADSKCEYSLQRLGKQAAAIGVFDEIVLWRPENLPQYIFQSPLMKNSYGGGYWAWKPCIIWETLQRYDADTVVCYIDAGCTVRNGVEWNLYKELMIVYETLLFKYRDEMPMWEKFGSTSSKIKCWTKKSAALFYDTCVGEDGWREHNKIWGGLILAKGKNNELVKSWLDIVLNHPEVIVDPLPGEEQYHFFAQHKHDQPTLTALSCKYHDSCLVLPELSETCGEKVAVFASRVRCANRKDYWFLMIKKQLRKILGSNYTRIKNIF